MPNGTGPGRLTRWRSPKFWPAICGTTRAARATPRSCPGARPLGLGETLTLEYVTSFTYKPVPAEQMTGDLCQYRRAVRRRMENADIRVEFDPGMLPRNVWWANWNGVAGEIINQESVALDSQNSAQRFLRFIEDTVVGFHWEW